MYQYPESAAFGRPIPKNKIYANANPGAALKKRFIAQVDKIIWQYKLAPETINIEATANVPEIQIFSITLKTGIFNTDVLRCIDQAIPLPIIFEMIYHEQTKAVAACKRPSHADPSKWTTGETYFETAWHSAKTERRPLPLVFNLEQLYAQLLIPLMPFPPHPGEGLSAHVARMERIQSLQRNLEKCQTRLRREKQFNRKVAINRECRVLKQKIDHLIGLPNKEK